MRRSFLEIATILLIAVVGAIALEGCGARHTATSSGVDPKAVRAMGDFYSAYVSEHGGKTPKDEQAFRDYLTGKQDVLQKAGLTVDKMFTSPRGGGLIVWVYGKRPPVGPSGISYFAYEKEPVDGKRLVIGSRGGYEQLDDAQFRKAFPNAS